MVQPVSCLEMPSCNVSACCNNRLTKGTASWFTLACFIDDGDACVFCTIYPFLLPNDWIEKYDLKKTVLEIIILETFVKLKALR